MNGRSIFFSCIALFAVPAQVSAFDAAAQAASFTYRGHLEEGGAPAQGRYDLKLTLYADRAGRQPLAAPIELTEVAVENGGFAVGLDFAGVPAHAHSGWLQVAVKSEADGDFWPLPDTQPVALKAQICPESWALAGNASTSPATNFLGTTDNQPLELRANNARVMRIEPRGPYAPAMIGGHPANSAANVFGPTIGGGGDNGAPNRVSNAFGTISGGVGNTTQGYAGVVPGGSANCAGGIRSFAAGNRAKVRPSVVSTGGCFGVPLSSNPVNGDAGTFVWADNENADFVSTGSNQFLVRARGGMGIGTNAPQAQLHVYTDTDAAGIGFEFNPALLVDNENEPDFYTQAIYGRVTNGLGYAVVGRAESTDGPSRGGWFVTRSTHSGSAAMYAENTATGGSGLGAMVVVNSPTGRALSATSPAGGHAAFFSGGRVFSQGNVGIGVVNPGFQLHLSQDSAAKPTSNTWTVSSDERLKTDIQGLHGSLEKLLALRGVSFRWRNPETMGGHDGVYAGLLAQNVEEVFPEWVGLDAEGFKTVTVTGFEGIVAEALRELRNEKDTEIAALRESHAEQIAALREVQERQIDALRGEVALLREMLLPAVAGGH